ncbi:MAG TPA: citrate synthase [Eoetvoesiella sp.]|jgi:citrate synthase|uniref:citrate synthase n=1 Tax=Eoetvoesiella sp. TaxID=1966355 RepID=UPI002CACA38D|nr:citrate synthase [Eoetvoesiella sp.]HWK61556.1 citrate synthase [Eoetvoesiella sp.]
MDNPDYVTREEAIRALQIKPATLYSYVSRGLLRRIKDRDQRRSMYLQEDVDRLKARRPGQPVTADAAAKALRWGEPVASTSITCLDSSGPCYRNRKAIELARSGASFEAVAHLLFTGLWQPAAGAWPRVETPVDTLKTLKSMGKGIEAADFSKAVTRAVLSLGMQGRGATELAGEGAEPERLIIQTVAGCMGFLSSHGRFFPRREGESIAAQVLGAAACKPSAGAVAAIDEMLIVLADHELASATFAARIAASTHSDLYCCVGAALCAHAGSATVAATFAVDEHVFHPLSKRNWNEMHALVKQRGTTLFGFNHPLYPSGDPRADYLLELVSRLKPTDPKVPMVLRFLEQARTESAVLPGIAVALVVFARALGMPSGAASALWIISRSAGWIAHALEQRTQGYMLRPRARFVGGDTTAMYRPG